MIIGWTTYLLIPTIDNVTKMVYIYDCRLIG